MSNAKSFKENFLLHVLLLSVVALLIVFVSVANDAEVLKASAAGLLLSIVNVLIGYAAIEFSFNKSYTQFIQIVLGGVLFRLLFMASALLILLLVFRVHVIALVVSLFGMYVLFLALEVFYIYGKWQKKINS